MAKKYLDENGLLYLWQKIKAKFISDVTYNSTSRKIQKTQNGTTSDIVTFGKVATSNNYNDLDNRPTIPSRVEKTTTTPKMDGTAAVGSETKFAAGDHVHPRDTTKADVTNTVTNVSMDNQYRLTQTINGATTTVTGLNVAVVNVLRGYPIDGKTPSDQYWLTSANSGTVVAMTPQFNILYLIMADQDSTGTKENDMFVWGGTQNGFVKVSSVFATSNASTSDPGLMSAEDKTKLAGIAAGAEINVQADWNETNTSSDAYIKNKPTIPSGVVVDDELSSSSTNPVQNKVIYTALKEKDAFVAIIDVTSYTEVKEAYELGKRVYAVDDNDMYTSSGVGFWNLVYYSATEQYFRFQYFWFDENADYPVLQDISLNVNDEWLPSFPEFSIASSDVVTTDYKGLMSPSDKIKLNKLLFDSNNLIDSSILPSYVDDVIEAYPRSGQTPLSQNWLATGSASGTVITPEAGKIYVLMADSGDYTTNTQFRWSGTTYVKLNDGGVTSITNAEIDTIIAS